MANGTSTCHSLTISTLATILQPPLAAMNYAPPSDGRSAASTALLVPNLPGDPWLPWQSLKPIIVKVKGFTTIAGVCSVLVTKA